MGKIMLNGKQYGVGGIEKAKDISYDNTQSGLSATNVQGAVDELKSGLMPQSGSEYIKLPDGTMIEWGNILNLHPTSNTGAARGVLYQYIFNNTVNFPVPFYSVSSVIVGKYNGSAGFVSWYRYDSTGISEIDIQNGYSSIANTEVYGFSYVAIGRWKA